MTYLDPFGRRYRSIQSNRQARANMQYQAGARGGSDQPTLEDYRQLSEAYQSLQKKMEEMNAQLEATQEAVRQQTKSAMDFQDHLKVANQRIDQLTQERDDALALAAERQKELAQLRMETTNYRTRLEQRLAREADEKRLAVLHDMLALGDHLDMAVAYWDQKAGPDADAAFRANLVATRDAFLETLRRHGVQVMRPLSEVFDPELHEAVGQIESQETPADRIARVVRTGYTVDDQLLRPARVMVSSGPAAEGV